MCDTNAAPDTVVDVTKRNPPPKPGPRALNAYRHGLTGQVRFFACKEEEREFQKHIDGYHATYNPVGAVEIDLCQLIADTSWRLHGVGGIEQAIKAQILSEPGRYRNCEHEQADVALEYSRLWKDAGHQFDLLSRYERRLQRNLSERIALLEAIQERRRAAEKEKQLQQARAAARKRQEEEAARVKASYDAQFARLAKLAEASKAAKAASQPVEFDFSKRSAAPLSRPASADFDFSKKSAVALAHSAAPPRS